jgi:hypothetical protein
MKLKTLLLSSAAAFAVVGGAAAAQAADLSVAEPVDYVKVCDAFGAGYWYIPGTDTCLKIGGLVQFDVNFHKSANVLSGSASVSAPFGAAGTPSYKLPVNHAASWDMGTEAHVNVTAKSMTEYGPLTGFIELRAKSNNSQTGNVLGIGYPSTGLGTAGTYSISNSPMSTDQNAYVDTAWLSLGMLTVGRDGSIYHYTGGYNYDGSDFDGGDNTVDQVRLTWAMSGFGIQLAIEDPRDRWGTQLSSSYSMPDIVGNITWAQGSWSGKLSGGFAETRAGSGFGASLGMTVKLDQIAPGDRLMANVAWAQNEVASFASATDGSAAGEVPVIPLSGGSTWSLLASFQHFWAPTLSSAVTFDYMNQSTGTSPAYTAGIFPQPAAAGGGFNQYSIYGNLVWSPVTGFSAGAEVGYKKASVNTDGAWSGKIRLVRSW